LKNVFIESFSIVYVQSAMHSF